MERIGTPIELKVVQTLDFGLHGKINHMSIKGTLLAVCDAKGLIVVHDVESNITLMKVTAPDEVLCLEWLDYLGPSSAMPFIFGTRAGQVGTFFHNEVSQPINYYIGFQLTWLDRYSLRWNEYTFLRDPMDLLLPRSQSGCDCRRIHYPSVEYRSKYRYAQNETKLLCHMPHFSGRILDNDIGN